MENEKILRKYSSPFTYYQGESLFLENPVTGYVRGFNLNPLEELIVLSVNEMLVTTSSLLQRFLKRRKNVDVSAQEIKRVLSVLSHHDYLNKYMFKNINGSHATTRCYTISTNGQKHLAYLGIRTKMRGYLSSLTSCEIKEILSTHQFILSQEGYTDSGIKFANVVVERGKDTTLTNHIFRTNALVQTEFKTVFVESVRASEDSENEFITKLHRIEKTLRESKFLSCTVSPKCELIIVCENPDHREVFGEVLKKIGLRTCFDILITDDVTCYNEPENCLTKIVIPPKSIFTKLFAGITASFR